MAAGNGFQTVSPDTRYGDSDSSFSVDSSLCQKFTCPGTGPIDISEIGIYIKNPSTVFRLAIYTHDAANDSPEIRVVDSESDELTINNASYVKISHTYATKPRLTGGRVYWLVLMIDMPATSPLVSRFATGGSSILVNNTYPNWVNGPTWETHTDLTRDYSMYVVYEDAGDYTEFYATPETNLSYAQMCTALSDLCADNPTWEYTEFGDSAQGNPITGVIVHPTGYTKTYLLDAGVHGDELKSQRMIFDWLNYLSANPTLYSSIRYICIPNMNPDGKGAGIRQNNNVGASRQVDLNRNFTLGWDGPVNVTNYGELPHSNTSSSIYYIGPSAESEPEVAVYKSIIDTYEPDFHVTGHDVMNMLMGTTGCSTAEAAIINASLYANGFAKLRLNTADNAGQYRNYPHSLGIVSYEWEIEGTTYHQESNRFIAGIKGMSDNDAVMSDADKENLLSLINFGAHWRTLPTPGTITQAKMQHMLGMYAGILASTLSVNVIVTTGSLTLTGYAPTVTVSNHQTAIPSTGSLLMTANVPTVTASDHKSVTPALGTLAMTGMIPDVTISGTVNITPSTGALVFTGKAPTISATAAVSVIPATGSLSATSHTPTVTASNHKSMTPPAGTLTLTGNIPTVAASANASASPLAGSLVLTGKAPTISTTALLYITPGTGTLTFTGYVPSVTTSGSLVVNPGTGSLIFTGKRLDLKGYLISWSTTCAPVYLMGTDRNVARLTGIERNAAMLRGADGTAIKIIGG